MFPVKKMVFSSALLAGLGISCSQAMAADNQSHPVLAHQQTAKYKKSVVENAIFRHFIPYTSITDKLEQPRSESIVYFIKKGDSLSEIAQKFNVSLSELVEYNRIKNPHLISVGLELKIPPEEKIHVVKSGDTLDKIAEQHQVSVKDLLANNPLLASAPDSLYIGQELKIPTIQIEKPVFAVNPKKQLVKIASRSKQQQLPIPAMAWPVSGKITSHYGPRWGSLHAGIDIWNEEESRAVIRAARAGKVIKVEYNNYGYGNHVVLDHGDGIETYYAHMREITVNKGDWVSQGAKLGYMGSTGNSTGYHLHFEIRYQGRPINPLPYLN